MKEKNMQARVASLKRKNDIRITENRIQILTGEVQPRDNDLGNKSWGTIDYMVKHGGYWIEYVDEFPKQRK